jgi:hypothetical protein
MSYAADVSSVLLAWQSIRYHVHVPLQMHVPHGVPALTNTLPRVCCRRTTDVAPLFLILFLFFSLLFCTLGGGLVARDRAEAHRSTWCPMLADPPSGEDE